MEADPDALAVAKDGDRVAVVDSDDENVEGVGWVDGGGRKSAGEGHGGEGEGAKEDRRRSVGAPRVGHGKRLEG